MAFKDPQPQCLFFDVFGTCVDWRKTVTDALWNEARAALNSPTSSIASRIRLAASEMVNQRLSYSSFSFTHLFQTYEQWGDIAQEWRNTYLTFTRSIAQDPSIPYKTVDQHHLDALRKLLTEHDLVFPRPPDTPSELIHDGSLWDEDQIQRLSLVWHYLDPWPDTVRGLEMLNENFTTCTLSNGNVSLLNDMAKYGRMPFTHIYSAEMFQSYKPSPKVYLGAAEKMGLEPQQCCMVAAHLDDLKYAKSNGFRTVYVERPQEERHYELKDEKWIVDVWVGVDENGFVAAAEKLR